MKCQILFSGKNKKNIINLSSAENAQRVVKVNVIVFIWATDHVITMLCHMTKNCGWQKQFRSHWYQWIQAQFYLENKFFITFG